MQHIFAPRSQLNDAMASEYFHTYNRLLVGLAYRMLGSVDDAEEVAQETFLRYQSAGEPDLENPRAWLTRVCTRICLDRLKRLSRQLENYPGQWLPEPFVEPVQRADIDETLSMALLVGLRELSSTERAVFLLHDIFDYRFAEVADALQLSPSNCRQLAVRARKKIKHVRGGQNKNLAELQHIADIFIQAIRDGDAQALEEALAENVQLKSDGGGKVAAVGYPLIGRHKVQTFLLRIFLPLPDWESVVVQTKWFNGAPGIVLQLEGHSASAYQLQIGEDGRITNIFVQRNPEKLRRLIEQTHD